MQTDTPDVVAQPITALESLVECTENLHTRGKMERVLIQFQPHKHPDLHHVLQTGILQLTDEVTRIYPVVSPFPLAGRWEREVGDMFVIHLITNKMRQRMDIKHKLP